MNSSEKSNFKSQDQRASPSSSSSAWNRNSSDDHKSRANNKKSTSTEKNKEKRSESAYDTVITPKLLLRPQTAANNSNTNNSSGNNSTETNSTTNNAAAVIAAQKSSSAASPRILSRAPAAAAPAVNDSATATAKPPQILVRKPAAPLFTFPMKPQQIAHIGPIKIMDKQMKLSVEELANFLTENTDFTVISVLGPQNSGKSTVINALAQRQFNSKYFSNNNSANSAEFAYFRVKNNEQNSKMSRPETLGMDVIITTERLILIDTEPLFSSHSYTLLQRSAERNRQFHIESAAEFHSLQLITLALAISHVVLVVSEPQLQPFLYSSIHSALLLKQILAEKCLLDTKSYAGNPELLFIINKGTDFSLKINDFQQNIAELLGNCTFRGSGMINNCAAPQENAINCFVLPYFKAESAQHQQYHTNTTWESLLYAYNPLSEALSALKSAILSSSKLSSAQKTTEKQWLQLVHNISHEIHNNSQILLYRKVLQRKDNLQRLAEKAQKGQFKFSAVGRSAGNSSTTAVTVGGQNGRNSYAAEADEHYDEEDNFSADSQDDEYFNPP
jgi:hypothetical protein